MNFTSEEHALVEVNIPKFEGNKEVADNINTSIEHYTINSIVSGETDAKSIKEASEVFNSEFKKFSGQFPEATQAWEAFVDGEVTYQSSEIICVAINTYTNTGGAHGNSVISFLNFNPSNGKVYKNEDLIDNTDDFKSLAKAHFNDSMNTTFEWFESAKIELWKNGYKLPENIGFSEDGLILIYNVFEIPALEKGFTEFTIPYEELSDHLKVQ